MFAQFSPVSLPTVRRRDVIGILGSIAADTLNALGLVDALSVHQPVVEEITLPISKLPHALVGTRFAQISDLHMGPHFGAEQLFPIIETVNALDPEFLMLTGDYANDGEPRVEEMLSPLQALSLPSYAIWGNHDGWGQGWHIQRVLQQTSVQILWNQSVEVKPHLWLVGLDDALCGRPNVPRALTGTKNEDTRLLMVHEPDYFRKVIAQQLPFAAQFSGHTHGGQVRMLSPIPDRTGSFIRPYILPTMGRYYVMGHYEEGERSLYVNRGLGFTGPALRLNCRPEITLFTLVRKEPTM